MTLTNQVAVITGASRGLGAAIAVELAKAGCKLALVARNKDELSQLAKQITEEFAVEVSIFPVDLASCDATHLCAKQVLAQFGQVDILINNAGVGFYKPFVEHTPQELNQIVDVNLKGTIHLCHALLPQMLARQSGQIINIASDLSHRALANMAVYAASKFAMRGFSLSLLKEVKNQGVKVSLLNPGIIDTCFNGNIPGHQNPADALEPQSVALAVLQILTQPQYQIIDELTLHPQLQDF